jgi:hypothetical protein
LVFSNRRRLAPRIGLSRDEASNDGHSFSTFLSLLTRDMILSSQYCFLTSLSVQSLQVLRPSGWHRSLIRHCCSVSCLLKGFASVTEMVSCFARASASAPVAVCGYADDVVSSVHGGVDTSSLAGHCASIKSSRMSTRYAGQRSRLVGKRTELSSGKSNETTA